VLKARVTDSNKAVQTLALDIVCRIASGMGKPFEKHTRFFALPVATVLADQKAAIRAAACQALTTFATACDGVESMVHSFTSALETTNPVQKGSLLQWIVEWFKYHEPSSSLDLSTWAAPVVSSLDDRNSDIRKYSQALLPVLILCAGFDYVLQQTNSLKPASRASAVPIIQAARLAVPSPLPPTLKPSVKPASIAAPPAPIPASDLPTDSDVPPAKAVASSKLTGVRRKLPQGTSRPESRADTPSEASHQSGATALKRPGAQVVAPISQSVSLLPFTSVSIDAKKARLAKDGTRWINEGGSTRKDLAEVLQHQMETSGSKELVARLFSHDHNAVNDHILGLTTMADLYSRAEMDNEIEEIRSVCMANFDLPLKYASIRAHEPQPNLISKCLDVVEAVLAFLRSVEYQLTDVEALCIIPTMIYKVSFLSFVVMNYSNLMTSQSAW
jgi:cytoskeleton-associated protein 5